MKTNLDAKTLLMIQVAVADAPPLTSTQIADLRRILRPEQWVNQPAARASRMHLGQAA